MEEILLSLQYYVQEQGQVQKSYFSKMDELEKIQSKRILAQKMQNLKEKISSEKKALKFK